MAMFTIRWAFRLKRALFSNFPTLSNFEGIRKLLRLLLQIPQIASKCQFSQKVSFDDKTDVSRKYLMSLAYLPGADLLETRT